MKFANPVETYRYILSIKAPMELQKVIDFPRGGFGTIEYPVETNIPLDLRKKTYKNGYLFWWWGVSSRGFFFGFNKSAPSASRALNSWLSYEAQQVN
jgi:hypothetical protein